MTVTRMPERMLDLGFKIGPLNGKAGFLPGGFWDFTNDRDVLDAQARRYPGCNWGGTRFGTIVLDEDPRNGGNLDDLHINLDTLVVRTGSGGRHAYFRHDFTRLRGKVHGHNGIDVKTWRTGYTVLPGSIHPETGELYRIETDLPIALLPSSLLPLLKAPEYTPQPTVLSDDRRNSGLVRKVLDATGGGRNGVTFWAFCRALERGSSDVVADIRSAAIEIGLPDWEVETCFRSAQRTVGSVIA